MALTARHVVRQRRQVQSLKPDELQTYLRATLARGFGRQLSDDDLDDMTQEALTTVVAKRAQFRGQSSFRTWATSIAVNTTLQELRRRRFAHVSLEEARSAGRAHFSTSANQASPTQRRQASAVLGRAIDEALTDAQRTALCAELGGLPLVEVSRRLGKTRGAVYKLLHDARKRLRQHIEDQGLGLDDLLDSEEAP
jgi:RNA polymerase sigma-70 factor (ECF subfamily)